MDRHARPRCQPNAFLNKRCKAAKRAHGELAMRGAASDTPFPAMARFDFSVKLEGLYSPGRQPMLKVVDRSNRKREQRSEEQTSKPQSLMRIPYAVIRMKKNK